MLVFVVLSVVALWWRLVLGVEGLRMRLAWGPGGRGVSFAAAVAPFVTARAVYGGVGAVGRAASCAGGGDGVVDGAFARVRPGSRDCFEVEENLVPEVWGDLSGLGRVLCLLLGRWDCPRGGLGASGSASN